ncbi:MAG: hypothetical protein H7Y02_01265 [Candidatus Obscuribacterales bacterium]|nr:hypothetical protein [Steroidobacteraceae bacterium]
MQPVDDLFAPESEPVAAATAGYVLCEFDGLAIAIPQSDVFAIEHGSELAAPLPGENVIGWFASTQGPWPVYALNRSLGIATHLSTERSFIVFLKADTWPLGILAQSVRIIGNATELTTQQIPGPLAKYANGINGVARISAKQVAYVFEQHSLLALLTQLTVLPEISLGVRYG